ncbi:MAG: type II toxin-antitoxin system PemK/MazF family toxin [Gammaproteobacteria bacterium]|nr:type II toxin-antitoxin system PemK/MazF family toxin [Gammaproteobacteria bacterium]
MKRGEVWWVSFDAAVDGEIRKRRPAVILSNDAANAALHRVQVIPLTRNTAKVYPGEALVSVAGRQGKATVSQLATASKQRLTKRLDTLSTSDLKAVEKAVLVQLGLRS